MFRSLWISLVVLTSGLSLAGFAQDAAIKPKPTIWLPPPSPLEERIRTALDERTDLSFTDTPLGDVLDFLEDLHLITIRMDVRALETAKIEPSLPVNEELSGITLRSALNRILKPNGLTFCIEDEVLKVAPVSTELTNHVTRVYPIPDLAETAEEVAEIMEAISTVVFDPKDGGSVGYVTRTKSLVIRQNRQGHDNIIELLESLRAVTAVQDANQQKSNHR